VRIETKIFVPNGGQNDPALIGHEFKHVEEMLDSNLTLKDRHRRRDPDVREVGNGQYESEAAAKTEQLIRDEMSVLILPPGTVELDYGFDLFSLGNFVLEGIYVQLAPR
jgi:hypothetical protein